jgi:3-dehydroquinate synthase
VPIVPFAVIGELPGERWLSGSGDSALRFGATGAGLLTLDVLLPIPSSVVGALLGGRLGFTLGFVWGFSGLCLGSVVGYGLGRLMPNHFVSELPEAPALSLVFLSRPVPVLAEAVAITAGAERTPLGRFLAASALGNACYAGALAGNGAALMPDGLAGPGLVLPMALPVVAFLAWRAWRD